MSDIRVLVVDDSNDVRKFVVQCVLEPNGFEALEATDGAEGVRRALKGGIDLVLLDFEMPKMNGLQVLDTLRGTGPDLPACLRAGARLRRGAIRGNGRTERSFTA